MTGAWLYARQGESLAIERLDETSLDLRAEGDADWHRSYTFGSDIELQDFLVRLEQHLLETGWTFQRFESEEMRRAHVQRRRSGA